MCAKTNLILIGMPGSGKSTIGRHLANQLGWSLVDTDDVIQTREKQTLQAILDACGVSGFIRKETEAICSLQVNRRVIATGGSVVLDRQAMTHLRQLGWIIYLHVPLSKIERRLWNLKTRGIVIKKNQSIRDIYQIRKPLYERYADLTVHTGGLSATQIVNEILAWFEPVQQTENPSENGGTIHD
jgi:shikimate kinase